MKSHTFCARAILITTASAEFFSKCAYFLLLITNTMWRIMKWLDTAFQPIHFVPKLPQRRLRWNNKKALIGFHPLAVGINRINRPIGCPLIYNGHLPVFPFAVSFPPSFFPPHRPPPHSETKSEVHSQTVHTVWICRGIMIKMFNNAGGERRSNLSNAGRGDCQSLKKKLLFHLLWVRGKKKKHQTKEEI